MTLGWPPSLPQDMLQGVQTGARDNAVRTEMTSGDTKNRRRDSVRVFTHTGEISVTSAQAANFWDFYYEDHYEGAEPFEWHDPRTGTTRMMKIVAPPQETHTAADRSRITLVLEEVPS